MSFQILVAWLALSLALDIGHFFQSTYIVQICSCCLVFCCCLCLSLLLLVFLQTYTGWLDIGVEQLLFIGKLCQIIACQSYTECMSLGKMKTAHGHEESLESLTSVKRFCLEYKEKGR